MLSRRELLKAATCMIPAVGLGLPAVVHAKTPLINRFDDEPFCPHRFFRWSQVIASGYSSRKRVPHLKTISLVAVPGYGFNVWLSPTYWKLNKRTTFDFCGSVGSSLIDLRSAFINATGLRENPITKTPVSIFDTQIKDRPFWLLTGDVSPSVDGSFELLFYQTDFSMPYYKFERDGSYYLVV